MIQGPVERYPFKIIKFTNFGEINTDMIGRTMKKGRGVEWQENSDFISGEIFHAIRNLITGKFNIFLLFSGVLSNVGQFFDAIRSDLRGDDADLAAATSEEIVD